MTLYAAGSGAPTQLAQGKTDDNGVFNLDAGMAPLPFPLVFGRHLNCAYSTTRIVQKSLDNFCESRYV
jgi:hypothetical protein